MLPIPRAGEHVYLMIPAVAENDDGVEITTPVGAIFLVEQIRLLKGEQGLQFQLFSEDYEITIFVDETDLVDECYLIKVIRPLQSNS